MFLQQLISATCKTVIFVDKFFYGQKGTSINSSDPYENPRVASFMAKFISWVIALPSLGMIPFIVFNHYVRGPSGKSWTLGHNLFINMFRQTFDRFKYLTVEQIQLMTITPSSAIHSDIICKPFIVPSKCRKAADNIVSRQFSKFDREKLDWDLKVSCEKVPDLKGEWLQDSSTVIDSTSDNTLLFFHGGAYFFGSYKTYRDFLQKIAKQSKKRTCAIDYRLSPQYPFPSALEDAMAAYLYLIDPPKESGMKPINPKKIVFSGDSSGGGLAVALLMAVRDAGLPSPSGAVVFSPLLDLTYSLPSIVENILTDFLPPMGHWHLPSPASNFIHGLKINRYSEGKSDASDFSEESINKDNMNIIRNDYLRIHYYVPNVGLKVPLVSPVFDKKCLRGLPKILIQCGDGERLRDESIYAALSGTGQFQDDKEKSLDSPSQITLEIYEDQPHDFQFLVKNNLSKRAIKNTVEFFVSNTSLSDQSVYSTEELLVVSKITPDGKSIDIKDELLKKLTKEKWNEWRYLLSKKGIKERLDYVNHCFNLVQ